MINSFLTQRFAKISKKVITEFGRLTFIKFLTHLIIIFAFCFIYEAASQQIDPTKYLATLYFHIEEDFFPIAFNLNKTCDGNHDGKIDVEDNIENYIKGRIGNNIYNQNCNIKHCHYNDQLLAVYFHHSISQDGYDVYGYWYYYAANAWMNKHEHDWESYFVYERNGIPIYIKFFVHQFSKTFAWAEVEFAEALHPKIIVNCGSYAMKLFNEKNNADRPCVIIYHDGSISGHKNILEGSLQYNWMIYSNDENVIKSNNYHPIPNIFGYGDERFKTRENSFPRPAPWKRYEWDNPESKKLAKVLLKGFSDTFITRDSHKLLLLGTIAFVSNKYMHEQKIKNRFEPLKMDVIAQKKLQITNERKSFRQRYGYVLGILSLEFLTVCAINALDGDYEIQVDRAITAFSLTKACLYSISLSEIANRSIGRKRPNGADNLSFFSGNTSLAFATASILSRDVYQICRELTGFNKYLLELAGLGAYVGATYVGYSEIRHGENYLSDVLIGAVIGTYIGNKIYGNYINDLCKQINIECAPQNLGKSMLSLGASAISLSLKF